MFNKLKKKYFYSQNELMFLKDFLQKDEMNKKLYEFYKAKEECDSKGTYSLIKILDVLQSDIIKIKTGMFLNNIRSFMFITIFKREAIKKKRDYLSKFLSTSEEYFKKLAENRDIEVNEINEEEKTKITNFVKKFKINKQSIRKEIDLLNKKIEKISNKQKKKNDSIYFPLKLNSYIIKHARELYLTNGYNYNRK